MSEIFAFFGYPARLAGRIPLLARYLSSGYAVISGTSAYAQARFGTPRFGFSYRWRPWLLPDLKNLEGIEDLINSGSNEKVAAFKTYQLSVCQMIAVVGAVLVQAGISALQLPSLDKVHYVTRSCFITSLILSLVAVFFACLQQRTFGLVGSTDEVRVWLCNGRQYQNQEGVTRFKASVAACQILQAPFELVSMAITFFIAGFGLYLGLAMTNELNLSAGQDGNRVVLIIFLVTAVFPLVVFGLLLGLWDMEQVKIASSSEFPSKEFGRSTTVGRDSQLPVAPSHSDAKNRLSFAYRGQEGAPHTWNGEDSHKDLRRALLEAAATHRQCAKANEEVAIQYERLYGSL